MKRLTTILLVLLTMVFAIQAEDLEHTYKMKRGLEAARQGNMDDAFKFFGQELQDHPENGYAHMYLAQLCEMNNMKGYALSFGQKAIQFLPKKDKPALTTTMSLLSDIYAEGGDTVKAMDYLDQAIKLEPGNLNVRSRRITLYNDSKQLDKVEAEARAAVKNNKDKEPYPYLLLAQALLDREKNLDEALVAVNTGLTHMLQVDKTNKTVNIDKRTLGKATGLKAQILAKQKNYPEALDAAISSLKNYVSSGAMEIVAEVADSMSMDSAIVALDKQIAAEPKNTTWLITKAQVFINHRQYVEAYVLMSKVNVMEPNDFTLRHLTFNATHRFSDGERAKECMKLAIQLDSTDVTNYISLADVCHDLGLYEQAEEALKKAMLLDADNSSIYQIRARAYRDQHDYEQAAKYFRMAAICEPDDPSALLSEADMYRRAGNQAKADTIIREFRTVAEKIGYELTAEDYVTLHEYDKAIEEAEKRIEKDPSSENNQYNLACVYALAGQGDKAMVALEKSLELGFRNFYHFAWDSDLDNLRDREDYKGLMRRYEAIVQADKARLAAELAE